jgi:hypothetical protein
MTNKEPGYVYILTNPSFREDWEKRYRAIVTQNKSNILSPIF